MIEYICDGCGKREKADKAFNGQAIKPKDWYMRIDENLGELHACSRKCIDAIAEKTGTHSIVFPI